ncbi:hypothetical protein [Devosia faecipullorum]|uniref:hypothetical protein n=1 Tax=Devosia faecipullorum TaxID=2755039 RepID=UPI00187B398B|nr:hypothetical protein [Devosia faecipullorum]MBE7732189.1 hypothetical protein [Devosia faecipullorum]
MRAILAIAVAVMLAGCASTTPVVPAALLDCEPHPVSPASDPAITQRDVAVYVVQLAEAGADCRSKLGSVRRLLTPETTR